VCNYSLASLNKRLLSIELVVSAIVHLSSLQMHRQSCRSTTLKQTRIQPHTLTHTLKRAYNHTHSLSFSHTHTLTHSLTHTLSFSLSPHSYNIAYWHDYTLCWRVCIPKLGLFKSVSLLSLV
jgi:hypothetical protein